MLKNFSLQHLVSDRLNIVEKCLNTQCKCAIILQGTNARRGKPQQLNMKIANDKDNRPRNGKQHWIQDKKYF